MLWAVTTRLLWLQDSVFTLVPLLSFAPSPSMGAKPTAHESYIEICYPQVRNCQ